MVDLDHAGIRHPPDRSQPAFLIRRHPRSAGSARTEMNAKRAIQVTGATDINVMHQAIETVLQCRDVNTPFFTETGVVKAVNGVSFDLRRGERVAIVGESGSGKSAMAMSLIQLLPYPGKVGSGEGGV